ncbi:MAG: hypothetical protein IPM25_08815 [Chloracidobacterium sp.]|nr:hypothetical protein [Chloracidobacterium sp.]
MNSVKVVMGFLEIGAALKFISNVDLVWGWDIFTREVVIAGWIALSILIFLYLLGVFRFSHDSEQRNIGLVRAAECLPVRNPHFLSSDRLVRVTSRRIGIVPAAGERGLSRVDRGLTNERRASLDYERS